jgi:diaminohydroxyphosphoribosylaminopyrimidine deaminase/5-amino-6-(5-phosphoribosylamino)uracil reductase
MEDADLAAMRRAIALARPGVGTTGDNPSVGCVIVRDGEVVGEGATGPGGRPHAEERALDAAGPAARGATAYVTLEPCARRSTGAASCSERLVAAGVARVFVACADPSVLADGAGVARLTAAGIEVRLGLAEDEAAALYAGYVPRAH